MLQKIYSVRVKVNNKGEICVSFVETKQHAFARNFMKVAKKRFS